MWQSLPKSQVDDIEMHNSLHLTSTTVIRIISESSLSCARYDLSELYHPSSTTTNQEQGCTYTSSRFRDTWAPNHITNVPQENNINYKCHQPLPSFVNTLVESYQIYTYYYSIEYGLHHHVREHQLYVSGGSKPLPVIK